jgi:CRP/FNR family transcriptional regulator, cyclic AMP receptor protein
MNVYEPIGYLASLLVLAAFSVRGMVTLRVLAIASNLAFIGYAALAGIDPVLLLHALLLPVNVLRLLQELRERPCRRGRSAMKLEC